jgi:hypothetical protein
LDPLDTRWNEIFERLVEYKEKHGSTMVPYQYEQDPELGVCVQVLMNNIMMNNIKQKRISEELIRKLDYLGFVWIVQ